MTVSVLVPYRPTPERDILFDWVRNRWERLFPTFNICVGTSDQDLFNRSQAINNARAQTDAEYLIVADADVIFQPTDIREALALITYEQTWVVPHERYYISNQEWTDHCIENIVPDATFKEEDYEHWETITSNTSALIVLKSDAYDAVSGFDERFLGWGYEDNAFFHSLNSLWGDWQRIPGGFCIHLNHPEPTGGRVSNPYLRQNHRLSKEYLRAQGNENQTLQIIRERNQ